MALNRFMHPRNIYKDSPPNFKELAALYPDLAPFIVQPSVETPENGSKPNNVTLDFENPAALRQLTRSLLMKDFKLDVQMPLNHLIPTVPSRLNYILWIEDLLTAHGLTSPLNSPLNSPLKSSLKSPLNSDDIWGLDIGAGASCIYGLLGARKNRWNFVVTETNEEAFHFAKENIKRNGFSEKIILVNPEPNDQLLAPAMGGAMGGAMGREFAFSMCNPPFFESQQERDEKAAFKPPKHARNPVAESDAVIQGGEVGFVTQMIHESVSIGPKIKICTAMLGKKSSVAPLKKVLQSLRLSFATTEFCQGRTMRWGVAWSTSLDLCSVPVLNPHKGHEKPLTYSIEFGNKSETECMTICLNVLKLLEQDLGMYVVLDKTGKERSRWRVSATKNTWANQRRLRRQVEREIQMENMSLRSESAEPELDDTKYLLQFHLVVKNDPLDYTVEFRWIAGADREALNGVVVFLKNHLKEFLV